MMAAPMLIRGSLLGLVAILIFPPLVHAQQAPTGQASNGQSTGSQSGSIEDGLRNLIGNNARSATPPVSQPESQASANSEPGNGQSATAQSFLMGGPEKWTSREGLSSSLQIILLMTVISLAPAILLMTTCYVRIIGVRGVSRHASGTWQ